MKRNAVRSMQMFFLVYAVICGATGITLAACPSIIATYRPDSPWVEHSFVRLFGAALVLAATGFASLRIVRDPPALWKAILWVGAGHFFLALVILAQANAIWQGEIGGS